MHLEFVKKIFAFFNDVEPIVLDFMILLEEKSEDKKDEIASKVIELLDKYGVKTPLPEFVLKWVVLEVIERLIGVARKELRIALDKAKEGCYN